MKNNRLTVPTIALALSLALSALPAHAKKEDGGRTGGGGAAVVCRDPLTHEIMPGGVRLLDLYEGEQVYGYNIPQNNAPTEQQIRAIYEFLINNPASEHDLFLHGLWSTSSVENVTRGKVLLYRLHPYLSELRKITKPLNNEVYLRTFEDFGDLPLLVKKGCTIEQVGFYITRHESNTLLVVPEIFDRLSNQDRAAFLMHEAVYKIAREFGHKDSQLSRHLVAALFSTDAQVDALELSRQLRNNVDAEWSNNTIQLRAGFSDAPHANRIAYINYDPNSPKPAVAILSLESGSSAKIILNEKENLMLKNAEPQTIPLSLDDLNYIHNEKRFFVPKGSARIEIRQGNEVLHTVTLAPGRDIEIRLLTKLN